MEPHYCEQNEPAGAAPRFGIQAASFATGPSADRAERERCFQIGNWPAGVAIGSVIGERRYRQHQGVPRISLS